MKKLLAAAVPLLVTSHSFGSARSTNIPWDTRIEAARDAGNGNWLPAQLQRRVINGQCGSANGVPVSSAPPSHLCRRGGQRKLVVRVRGRGPVWVASEVKPPRVAPP